MPQLGKRVRIDACAPEAPAKQSVIVGFGQLVNKRGGVWCNLWKYFLNL